MLVWLDKAHRKKLIPEITVESTRAEPGWPASKRTFLLRMFVWYTNLCQSCRLAWNVLKTTLYLMVNRIQLHMKATNHTTPRVYLCLLAPKFRSITVDGCDLWVGFLVGSSESPPDVKLDHRCLLIYCSVNQLSIHKFYLLLLTPVLQAVFVQTQLQSI